MKKKGKLGKFIGYLERKYYRIITTTGLSPKSFSGNLFERFAGLDFVFQKMKGSKVLDFGCCEGLVSYECARHDAKVIHGFDVDPKRIKFAKELFNYVNGKHKFIRADLAISGDQLNNKWGDELLGKYDIVLYLGVYHHLIKQTSKENVISCIEVLLRKTSKYFVVRTNKLDEIEPTILASKFKLVHTHKQEHVGLLKIYERSS